MFDLICDVSQKTNPDRRGEGESKDRAHTMRTHSVRAPVITGIMKVEDEEAILFLL